MIINRSKLPKFIVGKGSPQTKFGALKLKYRGNFEKSLVISLILTILLLRLTTSMDIQHYLLQPDEMNFELIDVLDIPPPPPQQLIMENVVEVVPTIIEIEESEVVGEVKEILDQIEEMLGENSEESQLTLASSDMNYLLSNSPMSSISGTRLKFRRNRTSDQGKINFGRNHKFSGELNASGLDIGSTNTGRHKVQDSKSNLDLGFGQKKNQNTRRPEKHKQASLDFKKKQGKILSFSSSTFGTEDYKLWNKIISELDRLNKGRFTISSSIMKRHRGGFVLSFSYPGGIVHEINWRNDGNVWIRVVGESSRTTVQELRQALGKLVNLSL